MMKVFLVTMLVLLVMAPAFAGTGNWVANGDFEQGMAGWTWGESPLFGGGTVAPAIFNASSPVPFSAYNGTQSGAVATALSPISGNAIGWAREGAPAVGNQAWSYVYQTVHVNPGTYNLDQSATKWDVIAGSTNGGQLFTGMFLVRVDSQIGTAYSGATGTYALRSSKWNWQDPVNAWFVKQINGGAATSFTTTTGDVQFILAFEDHSADTLGTSSYYGYAAFDNVRFETVEPGVPEPSSLLALLSGVTGLVGLVARRRR